MAPRIAVIVSTYNRPEALALVLDSLADQTTRDCEVIVADDGSDERTRELCNRFRSRMPVPLTHVWQEDRGFRLAAIRNRAVAASTAEYLVLLDGDCIVLPGFAASHRGLAEPGYFVRGPRVEVHRDFTEFVLGQGVHIHRWSRWRWFMEWRRGHVNRFMPIVRLPLGPMRKWTRRRWAGIHGSNLGVWREDFMAVNGFDEDFEGWGYEDWDFVSRLMKHGTCRKEGRFAVPVLHLWHAETSRADDAKNRQRFERQLALESSRAVKGVDQYL